MVDFLSKFQDCGIKIDRVNSIRVAKSIIFFNILRATAPWLTSSWSIVFFASLGPITALQTVDCDWSPHLFIEANFSTLTDSDKIFIIDFIRIHFHLSQISSQIIECTIFFLSMISLIRTLYNYLLCDGTYFDMLNCNNINMNFYIESNLMYALIPLH